MVERLTILYFDSSGIETPGNGGTSDTVWQMAHHAANLGHRAIIAGFYRSTKYPYSNVEVRVLKQPRWFERNIITSLISAVFAWRALRQMHDVQIIHLRDYLFGGIFLLLGHRPPVILTTPGNVYEREERGVKYFDPVTRMFFRWTGDLMARRSPRIIAHSQEQRDWWLYTGTSPLRMAQIPLGVDEQLFHPVPDARAQLGIPANTKIVLFVGRLYIQLKGLDMLLTAFEEAVKVEPKLELHLVGEGPDRTELEQWSAQHGLTDNVRFFPWVQPQELVLRYNAADVCVLTSRSESFSRIMVEAMACGVPFIGVPHGGMLDHIRQGENGYIIDPQCTAQLAETILNLTRDRELRSLIGANALAYIQAHLTWPIVMQRLISEVYEPIVQGK